MEGARKLERQVHASGPAAGRGGDRKVESTLLGWLRCDRGGSILAANATLARWLNLGDPGRLASRPVASILEDESLWRRWQPVTGTRVEVFELSTGDQRPLSVRAELGPGTEGQDAVEIFMVPEPDGELIARVARLEAALTLTAGTVHDVNNVLTVLSGNLFLLTEAVRGQEKLYEQARRARNAAERGSTLLRELLTFGREPDNETKAISPGNHVLALQPLLARAIGSDNALKVSIDRKTGSVLASAAQLESVLINLVINARDALQPHGEVHIRVRDARLDGERAKALGATPGDYVCVAVIDNGSGIPEHILHRVTEPLYSTKPKDRGSGLGLAMVRRFAEQAQGALQIESREGAGTQVTVWLPRTQQLAETTANMTLPLSTLPGGDERLLLVSRDRDMRAAVQQILEVLGYSVSAFDSLENAQSKQSGAAPPVLVISERSAAGLPTERRRLDVLKESNRAMKHVALLQAGTDPGVEAPDADGHVYRPVTVVELARTVREVLEDK